MERPAALSWLGCCRCSWVFDPPAPPVGENFDAVMRNLQAARDEAFDWHVGDKPSEIKSEGTGQTKASWERKLRKARWGMQPFDERGYGVSN